MKLSQKAFYAIVFGALLISVQVLIDIRHYQIRNIVPPDLERLVSIHPQNWIPIESDVTSPAWKSGEGSAYDKVAAQSYEDEYGNKVTIVMTWSRNGIQRAGHIQQLCYTTQGFSILKPHDIEVDLSSKKLKVTTFEASRFGGGIDDVFYWRLTGGKLLNNMMETKFNNYRLSHRILKTKELVKHLIGEIPQNIMIRISSVRLQKDQPSTAPLKYLREYIPLLSASDKQLVLGD